MLQGNGWGRLLIDLRWVLPAALCLLAWFTPRLGDPWLGRLERWGGRFAKRKWAAVLAVGFAALGLRLALLPILPIPNPDTHDEFSYLLAADTFAHGRLSNPPHPIPIFFETFHELQRPTYQSVYPPAQGAVLAVGELLGHPWIGVLLSMTLMCGVITWMLQAWIPAEWALLGGILVILRLYLFSYWLETYWGGAVAAIGGALVIGALPRIPRYPKARNAVLLGIGVALLANSRPLEGFIFCLPTAVVLACWLLFSKSGNGSQKLRVALPLTAILLFTALGCAYYNRRVTGDAFMLPRALYQKVRFNFPAFVWQSPGPRLQYSNPEFEDFYNVVTPREYSRSLGQLTYMKVHDFWQFFLGTGLTLPLAMIPWLLPDRRVRFLLITFACSATGLFCVIYFFAHYAAALTGVIFALLIQCMRHLRRLEISGRPVGLFLTRLVVVLTVVRLGAYVLHPPSLQEPWSGYRARIARQLNFSPGDDLILVRYAPNHNVHHEWVWNSADIDHSKTVWARDIPGVDLKPLLDYFPDRKVWLLDADAVPPRLRPFDRGQAGAGALASSQTPASRGGP
ncbi:MAG TPA: hypothetical protein VF133_05550 [Terriglobales bacterium]